MSGHKVSGRRGEAGQRPGPQDEARSLLSTLKTRTHKAVSPNHSPPENGDISEVSEQRNQAAVVRSEGHQRH